MYTLPAHIVKWRTEPLSTYQPAVLVEGCLAFTSSASHSREVTRVMCLWPHIRRAVLIKGRLYMLGISTFVGVCSARDAPGLLLYAVGLLHAAAVLLLAAAVLLPATANAKLCLRVTRES